MITVTFALAFATVAAILVTLRRVVSWRWIARHAVYLDIAVTAFALWAFSGQGVTGTLVGVLTGLVFSVTLHGVVLAGKARDRARMAAAEAGAKAKRAKSTFGTWGRGGYGRRHGRQDNTRIVGLAWHRVLAALALPVIILAMAAELPAFRPAIAASTPAPQARELSRPMEANLAAPPTLAPMRICSTFARQQGCRD